MHLLPITATLALDCEGIFDLWEKILSLKNGLVRILGKGGSLMIALGQTGQPTTASFRYLDLSISLFPSLGGFMQETKWVKVKEIYGI
jgi:hypothetical protein